MARKRLPKDVFEVGAATIAKLHFHTREPVSELALEVWKGYRDLVSDSDALDDLDRAATELVRWVREKQFTAPVPLLGALAGFCRDFNDDGSRRKKTLFGGLFFQPDTYDPDRVEKFIGKAQALCNFVKQDR